MLSITLKFLFCKRTSHLYDSTPTVTVIIISKTSFYEASLQHYIDLKIYCPGKIYYSGILKWKVQASDYAISFCWNWKSTYWIPFRFPKTKSKSKLLLSSKGKFFLQILIFIVRLMMWIVVISLLMLIFILIFMLLQ